MSKDAVFILGSASPRRKEILSFFRLPFCVIPSPFDERSVAFSGDPIDYCCRLSREKGRAIGLQALPVLTADTIVFAEGKIWHKPKDEEEALATLCSLSGKTHSVITAVTVDSHCFYEETLVSFRSFTNAQAQQYASHIEVKDKAGSYAYQEAGALIVEKIDGCYYNVIGLPLGALQKAFACVGIDLWSAL